MTYQPENPGDSIKPEWLMRELNRVGSEIDQAGDAGTSEWVAKATENAGGGTIEGDVNATDWSSHQHAYGISTCLYIGPTDKVTFSNGKGIAYLWAGPKPAILGPCGDPDVYPSTASDYEALSTVDHELLINKDSLSQHPIAAITGLENRLTTDETNLSSHESAYNPHSKMTWHGKWIAGTYQQYDVVLDGVWLMIANKQTTDRPAPQIIGGQYNPYTGTTTPANVLAKQVIVGSRYSPQSQSVLVTGYRIYTETGQAYRVFMVDDPTGGAIVRELYQFTATGTGWQTFNITGGLLSVGQTIDVVVVINEPDPTPTTWTGDWVYSTPNNETVPGPGGITHSSKTLGVMRVHYIDDNAGDRTTELQALSIGDTISANGQTWVIQSSSDAGVYIEFGISPAMQTNAGTYEFTFETVTETPIDYQIDAGYWSGNPGISGLFGADVEYGTITPDDNQYAIDLLLQDYTTSPDWDEMAKSGNDIGGETLRQEIDAIKAHLGI